MTILLYGPSSEADAKCWQKVSVIVLLLKQYIYFYRRALQKQWTLMENKKFINFISEGWDLSQESHWQSSSGLFTPARRSTFDWGVELTVRTYGGKLLRSHQLQLQLAFESLLSRTEFRDIHVHSVPWKWAEGFFATTAPNIDFNINWPFLFNMSPYIKTNCSENCILSSFSLFKLSYKLATLPWFNGNGRV